jgi:hypothetical protein
MKRHPLLTILMLVGGILMLLPGACAIFFMNAFGMPSGGDGQIILLWLVCFAISAAGIYLIITAAFR